MPGHAEPNNVSSTLVWRTPSFQMIQEVLHNPAYAGMFVYGRRKMLIQPGEPLTSHCHRLPEEEWDITVPDVYPAYITLDQFHRNCQLLRDNAYANSKVGPNRGAPREGSNLLQGLLRCGRCGNRMAALYDGNWAGYACRHGQTRYGKEQCQSFPARFLDQAVGEALLQAVQPASLELHLAALERIEQERALLDQHWQLKLEQARYCVKLAQRQYDAVDPDNRLVARELEKRWNEALEGLRKQEHEYLKVKKSELALLTGEEKGAIRQLAQDLPALWNNPNTTMVDRKQLLRLLVEDITLSIYPGSRNRKAKILIKGQGEAFTTLELECPPHGWHCLTDVAVVEHIRELAITMTDHQIAEELKREGHLTRTGLEWTKQRVHTIRMHYALPSQCRLTPAPYEVRGDGLRPVSQVVKMLKVSPSLVHTWIRRGVVESEQRVKGSYHWIRLTQEDIARLSGGFSNSNKDLVKFEEVMAQLRLQEEELWDLVKAGEYRAYRRPIGRICEWYLEKINC